MKAMILAAGRGERMRPLTDSMPKPLLEVNGQRLIEYHIKALASSGIEDIVINHAWLGHMIPEQIGDGKKYGVNISYSDEGEALETGGGIFKALPLLGPEPFLVVNGDVWSDYDFDMILNRKFDLAHLVLVNNPEHHPDGDFTLDGEQVLNLKGAGSHTFSGIGLYHPDLFEGCKPGKFQLAKLLYRAMEEKRCSGEIYSGLWFDIGTPERFEALDQMLSEKTIVNKVAENQSNEQFI